MLQREIDAAHSAVGIAKTAAFDELGVGVHVEREPDGTKTTGPPPACRYRSSTAARPRRRAPRAAAPGPAAPGGA
jgi:hypothetical protein